MSRYSFPIWRIARTLADWVVALLILFEEWGWAPLARAMGVLARLPAVAWLERRIGALPARAALLVLFLPALALLPVKVVALLLFASGRAFMGLALLLVAKIVGTAVAARLFLLTKPKLMLLPWFARWHARWLAWKSRLMARVRSSALWGALRTARARFRTMRGDA